MTVKRHLLLLLAIGLLSVSGFAFTPFVQAVMAGSGAQVISGGSTVLSKSANAAPILKASANEHTSVEGPFTIIRDGFWHITYDEDNTASCRFYKMPIRSPRGSTFSYALNAWVCEPYETRTLWYYVGDDEYLVEGWQNIDGVWYYFEERTGRMYADEYTPDGHYMGPDGVLVS